MFKEAEAEQVMKGGDKETISDFDKTTESRNHIDTLLVIVHPSLSLHFSLISAIRSAAKLLQMCPAVAATWAYSFIIHGHFLSTGFN